MISFFRKILQNRLKTQTQIGILGKNELSHWEILSDKGTIFVGK